IDMDELVLRVSRFLALKRSVEKESSASTDAEKTSPTFLNPQSEVSSSDSAKRQPAPKSPKSMYGIYRIENVAGKGGMGLVYKAYDEVLDRYVAIKVLSKEWASSREVVDRFHREAKLIAAVNHPAIAQIYTFAQEAGESYFALEWCPGGSV